MYLYRETESYRATAKQEAEVIVPPVPDGDAPVGSYRDVQILVPDGNTLLVGIDTPIQAGFLQGRPVPPEGPTPGGIGPNRGYKLASYPPGQAIKFRLLPHQFVIAASDTGLVYASVIVEHCSNTPVER